MIVTEESNGVMIIEDRVSRPGGISLLVSIALATALIVGGIYSSGIWPGRAPSHPTQLSSLPEEILTTHVLLPLLLVSGFGILILISALARSYKRVVLDRTGNAFRIEKIGHFGRREVVQEPLSSIVRARVHSMGDVWRLEFEIAAEKWIAAQSFNNLYEPLTMENTAERVNGFLATVRSS